MPIPSVLWPTIQAGAGSVAPVADLNATATTPEDRTATILAFGNAIPVIYGRTTIGARIATAIVHGADLLLLCVISRGEIDVIESVTADGEALPAGASFTAYTGTLAQSPDASLVAAFAARSVVYADALPGIAYAVVRLPPNENAGLPALVFTVRGRKVIDPRTGTTGYTDNPALALADFLGNPVFGGGLVVDSSGVAAVADRCDAVIGTSPNEQKRRTVGLALTEQRAASEWVNTLRAYAGCFVDRAGASVRLIADAPAAVEMSFTAADIVAGSLRVRKRGTANVPTVVRLAWSNPDKQFATDEVAVSLPGVEEGTQARRESSVALPGILRYAQAVREATERLNKLWLTDLEVQFTAFDGALRLRVGAVIEVTHPIGLSAKPLRVTRLSDKGFGRWDVSTVEYDPAVYSDAVVVAPTYADTTLPSPLAPPAVTGLGLAEEVYQLQTGTYASRIAATWDAAIWPYLSGFRVELYAAGALIEADTVTAAQWRSGPVREGESYTVRVQSLSRFAAGAWASEAIVALGKQLPPGNVAWLDSIEVGGEVRLWWAAAVDIDIWRYGVGYGPVGVTRAACTVLDLVDSLRFQTKEIPVGTWDFLVWAVDSVRNESPAVARKTQEVTLDAASFLVDSHEYAAPTTTGMAEFRLAPDDNTRYFDTEDGVALATKLPGAVSAYADVLGSYHAAQTSELTTEAADFGLALTGNWRSDLDTTALSGSIESFIDLSDNGSVWAPYSGSTAKSAGRFGRLRARATGSATLRVAVPTAKLRIDAVPREEPGSITALASGGTLVQLTGKYTAVKHLALDPAAGTTPITTRYDRVLVAPVGGLQLEASCAGGGAGYLYWRISTQARAILASDYLEYDVFVVQQASTSGCGGFEIDFTDSSHARDFAAAMHYPTLPSGVWQSVKTPLASVTGKTSSSFDLVFASDTAGFYKAVWANVRITDGAGTTRLQLWAAGEPTANVAAYSTLYSNAKCGPANSFLAYAFNSAAVQIAADLTYLLKAV